VVVGGTGADYVYGDGGNDTLIADNDSSTDDTSTDRLSDTEGTNAFYYDGLNNPLDIILAFGPLDTFHPH